jgi:anthranilate/para-aminobenzoate synthase component I
MKIILYSENGGWFDTQGFYQFSKPVKLIKYRSNNALINNTYIRTDRILTILEKLIKSGRYYALGFISYDFKEEIFNKQVKRDDLRLPHIYVSLFRNFEKINPEIYKNEKSFIKNINFPSKNSFISKVLRAKNYIEKGDIYQVNLAHRIEVEGFFLPEYIFFSLVEKQPTPYMMFIKDIDFSLISGSMELFLKKEKQNITTKPIKGTRKRGNSRAEDEALFRELKSSSKERAENLMITDLMRNDLNKIATDVHVENLFDIEKYSSLFQMVSTVKGRLKEEITFRDIIYNTFPPGSVTGAPKKRAIEIIDELEDYKRSIYCGATFLIKPDFDFVMSVAIRQSIFLKNRCYIYVGSGIVADSDPEKEYQETIIKAKANLNAMGIDL